MIDLRLLRSDPAQVRAALARRGDAGVAAQLDEILTLDARRRSLITELDKQKAERNEASRSDAQLVKQQGALPAAVVAQRRALGERIAELEGEVRSVDETLNDKTLYVPNVPLADVPEGPASANVVVRSWGTPRPAAADVKPHWEIGERLGILDLARGAKLAGSGFPVFVGAGARLVRALLQFMLDLHTRQHGYVEVAPPFVVRRDMMQGTGQLPKFAEDAYHTAEDDLFLVPRPRCRSRISIVTRSSTARACRSRIRPTRRASGAKRAPRGRTRAASCACISSTRWSWCAS